MCIFCRNCYRVNTFLVSLFHVEPCIAICVPNIYSKSSICISPTIGVRINVNLARSVICTIYIVCTIFSTFATVNCTFTSLCAFTGNHPVTECMTVSRDFLISRVVTILTSLVSSVTYFFTSRSLCIMLNVAVIISRNFLISRVVTILTS